MAQSFTNLLYHLIFSTKDGRPLITLEYQPRLYDAAFTVSQSHVLEVQKYLARQKEITARYRLDEFITFLKVNGIEYDERYV